MITAILGGRGIWRGEQRNIVLNGAEEERGDEKVSKESEVSRGIRGNTICRVKGGQ